MKIRVPASSLLAFAILFACGAPPKNAGEKGEKNTPDRLPYLGNPTIVSKEVNGKLVADTIPQTIPSFRFVNQERQEISEKTFAGKIYVADFFFTTCPTICPVMSAQLLRVYEAFPAEKNLLLLSHTIDPEHDTIPVLREYAEKLGVTADRWHFVTGNRDSIYMLSEFYMVTAEEAPSEPGGFIHSGSLILIDKNRHIRGIYDGTNPKEVDRLIRDIPVLLREP